MHTTRDDDQNQTTSATHPSHASFPLFQRIPYLHPFRSGTEVVEAQSAAARRSSCGRASSSTTSIVALAIGWWLACLLLSVFSNPPIPLLLCFLFVPLLCFTCTLQRRHDTLMSSLETQALDLWHDHQELLHHVEQLSAHLDAQDALLLDVSALLISPSSSIPTTTVVGKEEPSTHA